MSKQPMAGAEQAVGDARQDQRDVTGAECADQAGSVGGDGRLAERRDEVPAVVNELADEREQTAGAAWWG